MVISRTFAVQYEIILVKRDIGVCSFIQVSVALLAQNTFAYTREWVGCKNIHNTLMAVQRYYGKHVGLRCKMYTWNITLAVDVEFHLSCYPAVYIEFMYRSF